MLHLILPRATQLAPHLTRTSTKLAVLRAQSTMAQRRIKNPAFFICDLQEKFRPAIFEFSKIITTTQKMLKASQILNIPVYATTQNKARLGETCPELGLDAPDGVKTVVHADKTAFSMLTPSLLSALPSSEEGCPLSCVIMGIESHVCVTQTALDLVARGHKVYVLADAVSSCNKEEIPLALARLRAAGVVVTTSESWLFECMGDAAVAEFRPVSRLVRDEKEGTREVLGALFGGV